MGEISRRDRDSGLFVHEGSESVRIVEYTPAFHFPKIAGIFRVDVIHQLPDRIGMDITATPYQHSFPTGFSHQELHTAQPDLFSGSQQLTALHNVVAAQFPVFENSHWFVVIDHAS